MFDGVKLMVNSRKIIATMFSKRTIGWSLNDHGGLLSIMNWLTGRKPHKDHPDHQVSRSGATVGPLMEVGTCLGGVYVCGCFEIRSHFGELTFRVRYFDSKINQRIYNQSRKECSGSSQAVHLSGFVMLVFADITQKRIINFIEDTSNPHLIRIFRKFIKLYFHRPPHNKSSYWRSNYT